MRRTAASVASTFRQPDVDHKLVALGEREEPLGDAMEHETARCHGQDAACDRDRFRFHGHNDDAVVNA
jgi:hypothetical protein